MMKKVIAFIAPSEAYGEVSGSNSHPEYWKKSSPIRQLLDHYFPSSRLPVQEIGMESSWSYAYAYIIHHIFDRYQEQTGFPAPLPEWLWLLVFHVQNKWSESALTYLKFATNPTMSPWQLYRTIRDAPIMSQFQASLWSHAPSIQLVCLLIRVLRRYGDAIMIR